MASEEESFSDIVQDVGASESNWALGVTSGVLVMALPLLFLGVGIGVGRLFLGMPIKYMDVVN